MPYTDDEEIHALLHYNPPSIKASPVTTDGDAPALSFYDKHLSPNLALKRVVHLPTLLQDMTKALDACMDIIEAQAITLPPVGCNALSIARLYETTTGENCQTVASTLVLTPHCSLWLPAVFFGRVDTDVEDNPTDQSFSLEEYSLCLPSSSEGLILHPQIKECLSASNLELLQHLFKRDRRLSTWEFLPYTSQAIDVIQNLCSGKSRKQTARRFEMRVPQSIKIKAGTFQSPDVAIPLDVEVTPWHPQDLTRNLRPRRTSSLTNPADCPSVKFCFASPRSKSLSTVVNDVLQHAWVTACRRDSTFIVFQCGNYERIGVRHRATQTLYLSDVIDVPNITDPGSYTELHLNLYVLILRDALQRAAYLRPKDDVPPLPRKRRREEGEVLAGTRQGRKLRSYGKHSVDKPVANSATSKSYDDIRSRNLLLVSLQYGVYSSPKPAAFFRPGHHPIVSESGRVVYTASEYIHIRLTSLITRGGTGTVHEGKLETYCKDGLRMMHEATIYEHLTKSGVSCIPTCYGIFEEPHDDGPSVLVTSHEGYWLQHWNRGSTDIAVPKNWRNKFLQAMKGIHDANVCHRDIRPENLVVNASGDVCIIDFDRADLTSSIGARKREYEHLRNLLEGDYTPPGSFPSFGTASPGSGCSPPPIPESKQAITRLVVKSWQPRGVCSWLRLFLAATALTLAVNIPHPAFTPPCQCNESFQAISDDTDGLVGTGVQTIVFDGPTMYRTMWSFCSCLFRVLYDHSVNAGRTQLT
ncbi:Protein kinase domain-containing protein [Pleurotus pulmonarius]